MLVMSRDPQDTEKIQAPSIPELKDALQARARTLGRKVSFRGRKMGYGPLLNAIVIHFLGLTEEQQHEIARAGIARYEELLEADEATDLGSVLVDSGKPGRRSIGLGAEVVRPKRANAKRKN